MTFGRPARDLLDVHIESDAPHVRGDRRRDLRFAGAPGTSDGFTESIATRSRRRSMAGSWGNAECRTLNAE